MRKSIAAVVLAAFCLAACAKDPGIQAAALLKAGDRVAALQLLEKARADSPAQAPTRMSLFVLYQYFAAQGEPTRHDAYLQAAIDEYAWIAKAYGIAADYRDMEGSLKSNDKARAAYAAAYAAVYAR